MAMIEFKNNAQIAAEEASKIQAEKDARERQVRPVITSLSSYLMGLWEAAKESKSTVEEAMIKSLRQLRGEYDPDKLAEIRAANAPEIFMMLTDEKCSAVSSWINDILFPGGEKPWGIKPTPVPELNQAQQEQIKGTVIMEMRNTVRQELMMSMQSGQIVDETQARQFVMQALEARAQEVATEIRESMEAAAKEARDRIETKLHDVVIESGWEDAMSESIDDVVIFKAGIIKGPVLRRKKRLKWKSPEQGSIDQGYQQPNQAVEVTDEISIDFNRVSPFDVYPLPNAKTPQDGMVERHRLSRKFLTSLLGVKGYDEDAIKFVLQDYGRGGGAWLSVPIDTIRQTLEDRPNEWRSTEQNIDALQFWVNVQGLLLLQYGMSPEDIQDPFADYPVEVWLIGRYVIKAEINGDPLGRVPYNFASFRKRPGSIWGAGVPEIIIDAQSACNASARAIVANMGIASGPQVMVDQAQLPPGARVTSLYPWKVWLVNRNLAFGGSSANRPVDFFVPPSVAGELIQVYQFFSNEADNKTGVPKYAYGGESRGSGAGALNTATGFTTMMSNATRGIKRVIKNIDKGIIEPSIARTHEFQLLMFNDPEYFQGDIKIIAKGSTAMIAKEQSALRRNELLGVVTRSQLVLDIIGKTGLASMLREIFQLADFKDDDIVPDKKTMALRVQQEQQMMLEQQAVINQQGGQGDGKKLNQVTDAAGNKAGGADVRTV
ncbi:MAG TPA: hypothetical protein VGD14_09580 [bacterium]